LNELSAELLHLCLHETALPALLDGRQAELVDEARAMEQLLGEHQLTKLSMPAVRWWMKCLGFKHKVKRKICCVDGHEKPESKKRRKTMVSQHLKTNFGCQSPATDLKDLEEVLKRNLGNGQQHTDPQSSIKGLFQSQVAHSSARM
jgi:hypothetical protein